MSRVATRHTPPPATSLAGNQPRGATTHRRRAAIGASFTSALEALSANRLRSLLTTLGVIVGVAAVIVAVTITQGASASINARVTGLGTNLLTITGGATNTGGVFGAVGSSQSLTLDDASAVASVSHVANATPVLSKTSQVIYQGQNWNTRVQGVYPNFQPIGNWELDQGSWYTDADETSGTPVAVLGQTVSDNLFTGGAAVAVGQSVLINGQSFRVVGVLKAKGAVGAANQDDVVFVPFSAALERLKHAQYIDQIQAQVDAANNVNDTQQAITDLLEQRHRLPAGGPDDFQIRSSNQLVQTTQALSQTLTFLLVGIAAISLLVGGIGIMNIMLVSVTERTREIGVRMAIGARRGDIRDQFLIEALTLSAAGGLIGIALGLVGGLAMTQAFSLPFAVSPVPILLAFVVAGGIGVIFGFYPAVRASRLDPIVALRTE